MRDPTDLRRLLTAAKSGIRGIQTAPAIFTTSVVTMTAGLWLLGAYLLAVQNMRATLERVGDEFTVYAYLPARVEVDAVEMQRLRQTLMSFEDVEAVTYVSREEAMAQLELDLGEQANVLQGLTENPLPASFELRLAPAARTPERVQAVADASRRLEGIEDARFGAEWVGMYARGLRAMEISGLVIGLGIFLVLSVVVGGTVRLAVYARADEIEIQRLVGAGAFYVRLPFYIQGALQGALGAILATGLLYGLYRLDLPLLGGPLELMTGGLSLSFLGATEVLLLLFVGIGLGVAGATLWLLRLEPA